MGIQNRVALVTGSASGMGKQTALRFAERGAAVVINDIDAEKVRTTVDEFSRLGHRVLGTVADISNKAAVDGMVQQTVEAFGRIDILVNNAGMERAGALRKLSEADWDITVDVNLKGTFLCTQAVHGHMVENKHGRIVNIASRAWLGGAGQTPYSSAKAGVVGMTRALAIELGRSGITVNCVAPGLIHTPMWEELPEKDRNFLLSRQPTGKLGEPDDIANTLLFLADDDTGFVTGQVLYVCGGRSLFAG
ncbi:SDR family NAD(P)-dependent oxidoreductase [Aromatoleum aromaticum]|uniref:Subunit of 2-[hydroxy(Phenyl)methyl]-succinyl-CoA DH n=1 Tax=Aromatoleum aromaticum (strain DSM 19018 / LMG 30748 / EbN1) TaxID=76114 RepID=Q5P686_AROAE|nr:SDR family NAD(P)-dependent oxidoreductase [Aromatoleum aromaticum]NMG54875.1 glucose 1-dehydrogenase [Aromatoleum aromaticum]CAI07175.1 subunit of 2-[hydroxy(phenyl)methyl]-succinyl-CoA DH [Aromatoleum aromaticum EbN1]